MDLRQCPAAGLLLQSAWLPVIRGPMRRRIDTRRGFACPQSLGSLAEMSICLKPGNRSSRLLARLTVPLEAVNGLLK